MKMKFEAKCVLSPSSVEFSLVTSFAKPCTSVENTMSEGGFIVNTDPDTKPGEHWLAVYYTKYNQFNFFDSYGLSPSTYGFDNGVFSQHNKRCVQAAVSDTCGQHCIYYLVNRFRGNTDPYSAFPMSTPKADLDSSVRSFVESLPRSADEVQIATSSAFGHSHTL